MSRIATYKERIKKRPFYRAIIVGLVIMSFLLFFVSKKNKLKYMEHYIEFNSANIQGSIEFVKIG